MCFTVFLWPRIIILALLLRLIWYYSWVSNIGDLVSVKLFWFIITNCSWFCTLQIISNLLKIRNGWTAVESYGTTLVHVGTHFLPQFLENSRPHFNACNIIFSKNHKSIKWEKYWKFNGKSIWYHRWSS